MRAIIITAAIIGMINELGRFRGDGDVIALLPSPI